MPPHRPQLPEETWKTLVENVGILLVGRHPTPRLKSVVGLQSHVPLSIGSAPEKRKFIDDVAKGSIHNFTPRYPHCSPRSTSVVYPPKIASFSSFITSSAQNFASHAPQLRQGGARQLHHLPFNTFSRRIIALETQATDYRRSNKRLLPMGTPLPRSLLLRRCLVHFGAKNIPKEIIDGFCRRHEISAKCITRPPWT